MEAVLFPGASGLREEVTFRRKLVDTQPPPLSELTSNTSRIVPAGPESRGEGEPRRICGPLSMPYMHTYLDYTCSVFIQGQGRVAVGSGRTRQGSACVLEIFQSHASPGLLALSPIGIDDANTTFLLVEPTGVVATTGAL